MTRFVAPVLAGGAVALTVAVSVSRWIRFDLLVDPDATWALARLLLGLAVIVLSAGAGSAAAAALVVWNRSAAGSAAASPLPFSRGALAALIGGALAAGILLRLAWLETVPSPLFQDDVTLAPPALELRGTPGDFANSIRPAPYGVRKPFGSVGVLYLELYRASLRLFGTTVFGVRFVSFLGGIASLITAGLLARELLPRGGAALAVLILAGLRWHLILSRWAWVMIVIAPLLDLAALFVLKAKRRGRLAPAVAAGLAIGIAAHVYLAAWVALVAIVALALWPAEDGSPAGVRLKIAAVVLAVFGIAASPLFLLRAGRTFPYFVRTGHHNVLREIRYTRSLGPPVRAAADALAAAWIVGDPEPRHDLPGRSRLGWLLGIPAAATLAAALRSPRRELPAYLFTFSGTALAAAIASGEGGNPNSLRFGYLSTAAAVVSSAGILILLSAIPGRWRRPAAIAAVGALAISGALSARAVLLDWSSRPETDRSFHGVDTRVARAAIRWERYGAVSISRRVGVEPTTIDAVRRLRLDPEDRRFPGPLVASSARRSLRIEPAATPPDPGERAVERIVDPRGRTEALVLARRLSG